MVLLQQHSAGPVNFRRLGIALLLTFNVTGSALAFEGVMPQMPASVGPAEQAYSAYQKGDFDTARTLWQQAATAGDTSAQYNLGLLYAEGRGLVRNPDAAMTWWRLAARSGHLQAQHNLALAYLGGETIVPGVADEPRMEEAISWLRKAAEGGLASSRFTLGSVLHARAATPKEQSAALAWLIAATQQDHREAQLFLGNCYFDGEGVGVDRREALSLFLKAASHGHAPAQDRLAALYQRGDFVRADKVEALAWARLAGLSGLASAQQRQQDLEVEMSASDIEAATLRANALVGN
jgi:TPR repeat protein